VPIHGSLLRCSNNKGQNRDCVQLFTTTRLCRGTKAKKLKPYTAFRLLEIVPLTTTYYYVGELQYTITSMSGTNFKDNVLHHDFHIHNYDILKITQLWKVGI
jgi:hypothetical protein